MDSKTTSIVSYLTWIGLIIAYASGTKDELSVNHMNNSLVCVLFSLAGYLSIIFAFIPIIGWILDFLLVCWSIFILVNVIIGIVHACKEEPYEMPLLGKIHIIKLPQQ